MLLLQFVIMPAVMFGLCVGFNLGEMSIPLIGLSTLPAGNKAIILGKLFGADFEQALVAELAASLVVDAKQGLIRGSLRSSPNLFLDATAASGGLTDPGDVPTPPPALLCQER